MIRNILILTLLAVFGVDLMLRGKDFFLGGDPRVEGLYLIRLFGIAGAGALITFLLSRLRTPQPGPLIPGLGRRILAWSILLLALSNLDLPERPTCIY